MWITYFHTYAASEYFVNTSINTINAIATNYQKYVNDRLNHSVGSTYLKSTYAHIKNMIRQFHHEDDFKKEVKLIQGVKLIDQDFH